MIYGSRFEEEAGEFTEGWNEILEGELNSFKSFGESDFANNGDNSRSERSEGEVNPTARFEPACGSRARFVLFWIRSPEIRTPNHCFHLISNFKPARRSGISLPSKT